jgi:fatty acid desaturase
LHVVHHEQPALPWYALPAAWRQLQADRGDAAARTAGMIYAGGYREVIRRYLLRPVIDVEHPHSPVMEQPTSPRTATATGTATVG